MYKTLGFKWLFEVFCPASAFATADREVARNPQRFIHVTVGGQFKKRQNRYKLIPMRELSETEKDVIRRLIEWEDTLKDQPHNFNQIGLDTLLRLISKKYNSSFEINFSDNEIILKSTSEKKLTGLAENNSFRRDYISLVHFIDYLKSERLVYLVPTDPDIYNPFLSDSHLYPNKEPFVSRINDSEFLELLSSLFFKHIYPTEYLVKYYKQGCKTDEETRFNDSIKISNKGVNYAKYSIWVAIAIGITSIILTFVTLLKPNNDTQLILNRIDRFEEKTDIRFDSIDNRLKRVEYELFVAKPWEKYYQELMSK